MTTKWISQIFSGGEDTKNVITPPAGNPDQEEGEPGAIPDKASDSRSDVTIDSKSPPAASGDDAIDYSKFVVLLLYGKNSFGDQIYSYLKISLGGIEKLKVAMLVGNPFNPSDFGTIIAAGRGEPSDEVRTEIASQYYVLTAQKQDTAPKAAPITETKSWDEF